MKQYTLNRKQMLNHLEKLALAPPLLSLYVEASTGRAEAEQALLSVFDRGAPTSDLAERVAASPNGAALFYGGGTVYLVLPPFPLQAGSCERSYHPRPLRDMLEKEWRTGLVLVRLGQFAIAVFHGEKLLAYKAGTGLVHARHHKGGSSANRFARHREKQMESLFTRVEIHAREILEPRLREIDYIIYGGVRSTLQALWRQCGFFARLEAKALSGLLNVREPKYSTLPAAIEQAYSSTVYELSV